MKKNVKLVVVMTVSIFFITIAVSCKGCSWYYFGDNLVDGIRWESEDPKIWFECYPLGDPAIENSASSIVGEIVLEDDVLPIEVNFRGGSKLFWMSSIENSAIPYGMEGRLKNYGQDWFTLEVLANNIPNSTATEITFRRV